ncbi:YfhO family protein [Candidatus Gottesmanbacteria bacterium]|nr:YfhO family protein [Candidatus Gottesmanbacteria bacterium]
MKTRFKPYWPVLVIFVVWFIFSSPYFLRGLIPFPSKYLVTFFAPWSASYGMPLKNNAMPDVITQIYPWKKLTMDTWKGGHIPLWNPYSFSGTVHAGNYQSAVFSPFNLLFLFLPMVHAWSVLVLLQPLLAGLFMYIYLRSLAQSREGSLVGSLAFMFCGFIVVWMAYATLGYAALWLPLLLFAVQREFKKSSWWNVCLVTLGLAFSFLSGHFQISVYVAGLTAVYILWEAICLRKWRIGFTLLVFFIFGLLLASPQLITAFDAFAQSVRSSSFGKGEVIPWQYLITLVAPDFFGNPVTRNDWFGHYAEWAGFIGVVPLFLAVVAIFGRKDRQRIFFVIAATVSFAFALPTFLNDLIYALKVPVLSTSGASRVIVLASFCLATLSGFGFDELIQGWREQKRKGILLATLAFIFLMGSAWGGLKFGHWLDLDKSGVAIRNFILPSLFVFGAIALSWVGFVKNITIRRIAPYIIIIVVATDMLRFAVKWMPFDPKEFVYPVTPAMSYLQKNIGNWRIFGTLGNEATGTYGLPSLEGYDALYQSRYGEFVGSAASGKVLPAGRSVVLVDKQGIYTDAMLQLLGVRYLAHRVSDGRYVWAYPFWQYPSYQPVYKDGQYEIMENEKSFPRAFMASSYIVAKSDQEIIDILWRSDFPRRSTIVLEQDPGFSPAEGDAEAKITRYLPTEVSIAVTTKTPQFLFLSDVFEKGWKATVDGSYMPIFRADYVFRAVPVPAGDHVVRFYYSPDNFRLSLLLAAAVGVILGVGSIVAFYEHRHI